MYTISNKQMEDCLRFVELYRRSVDVKTCDNRAYNAYRVAGILLRQLRAKKPVAGAKTDKQQTA